MHENSLSWVWGAACNSSVSWININLLIGNRLPNNPSVHSIRSEAIFCASARQQRKTPGLHWDAEEFTAAVGCCLTALKMYLTAMMSGEAPQQDAASCMSHESLDERPQMGVEGEGEG